MTVIIADGQGPGNPALHGGALASFADNRDQAWLMCVIEGQASLSHGTPDVQVKPYFLRDSGKGLAVLPTVNWKTYDSKC